MDQEQLDHETWMELARLKIEDLSAGLPPDHTPQYPLTFYLPTTPSTFARWVQEQTKHVWGRKFPTQKGYVTLEPARAEDAMRPAKVADDSQQARLLMWGDYHYLNKHGEVSAWVGSNAAIVFDTFLLIPGTSPRLEVQVRCNQPVVEPYLLELLIKIGRAWEIAELKALNKSGVQESLSERAALPARHTNERGKKEYNLAYAQMKETGCSRDEAFEWYLDYLEKQGTKPYQSERAAYKDKFNNAIDRRKQWDQKRH